MKRKKERENFTGLTRMYIRACTSISRQSSHFTEISDFSWATLPGPSRSRARSCSPLLSLYAPVRSPALSSPPPLAWPFIPNKAISNSCGDGPYVRLLGDNLYTRTTYVITYSLDTSFSRAATTRRFHGFVPSRLVTERIALLRATLYETVSSRSLQMPEREREI